jgi:hypothetical protein
MKAANVQVTDSAPALPQTSGTDHPVDAGISRISRSNPSNGKRLMLASDEYPVPKSSMAIFSPST